MTRLIRGAAMTLVAVSLTIATSSVSQADPVAATRSTITGYWIDLEGINNKSGSDYSKYSHLTQFWSKISDSSVNAIGSGYGAEGQGSGEFRSFCIDLNHSLATPPKFNEATITEQSGIVGDNAAVPFDRDLGKAGWLVNNFSAGIETGEGWNTGALANLSVVQRASALQGAIWVAAFGVADYTVKHNASATVSTAVKVQNAVADLITALGTNTAVAGFINYPPPYNDDPKDGGFRSQDQVFAAAPEPSTFAIAGLGALAFAGHRLRRRRSS